MKKNIALSILSAIFLSISWPTFGFSGFIFIAFVPLLLLVHNIRQSDSKRKGATIFAYSYFAFLIWNIVTTWWILNSTIFGGVFALVCNSLFFSLLILFYYWITKIQNQKFSLLFLIVLWISFEKFHMIWDFSWPWLTLGNVFSESISWIQWYEYTGVFGGSVWVLIANCFIFSRILKFQHVPHKKKLVQGTTGFILLWIAVPISISLLLYPSTEATKHQAKVIVLQPNIDPYDTKYTLSNQQLLYKIATLTKSKLTTQTNYLITPESYFDENPGLNLNDINTSYFTQSIQSFLDTLPNLNFVAGTQAYKTYLSKEAPTPSANYVKDNFWVDIYNIAIDYSHNQEPETYIKSKLVVGVEFMPYKSVFEPLLGNYLLDLGGTIMHRSIQESRTVFYSKNEKMKTAPIICYESIYGEFVSDFVKEGATFLSVLTNDAWWGNTQGHKQLLSYTKLRAIETRRAIARSANTGISAFITRAGEITSSLGYEKEGVLESEINLYQNLTFYTRYGDYLARLSYFMLGLMSIITLSKWARETKK